MFAVFSTFTVNVTSSGTTLISAVPVTEIVGISDTFCAMAVAAKSVIRSTIIKKSK